MNGIGRRLRALVLCAASLLVPGAAPAQGLDSLSKIISFATPAAPALAFIGGSAERIARPTTPKDVATSFLSAVNESGKLIQGFAVELGSALLARNVDRDEYRTTWGFLRSNVGLSIGTAKVSGDSAATDLGVGLRALILNGADPYLRDGGDSVIAELRACLREYDPNSDKPITQQPAVTSCYSEVAVRDSVAQQAWAAERWNAWSLGVSVAHASRLADSDLQQASAYGWTASAVLAMPMCLSQRAQAGLCRRGQWLVEVSRESRDSVAATQPELDRSVLGVRLNLGTRSAGFLAEYLSAVYDATATTPRRSASEWSLGVEWRATDDIWLATGVGSRYDAAVGTENAVVFGGMRLNAYSKRKFSGPHS